MEKHGRKVPVFNGQDNNSSTASDSGTSTDWDGCWGTQECSACGGEGHNMRNCRAKRTMNFGAPGAIETITATTLAD